MSYSRHWNLSCWHSRIGPLTSLWCASGCNNPAPCTIMECNVHQFNGLNSHLSQLTGSKPKAKNTMDGSFGSLWLASCKSFQ
ncbi:hypothetical protein CEXT_638071 [Caerostris extrusa]|uniref:Uncharacterized protein n=1 Tax=Caerostris extrusa TaxID=172846 RepID=A0AAV4RPC9_CAEEX|nr:hypothetical protein CEXT_638071 [Caerostris extrusa]